MECLNEIVGLLRKDCECITDGLTREEKEELTTSTSGLFIDTDLNGVINLRAINNPIACKNMATAFKNARQGAISKFRESLFAGIFHLNTENKGFNGDLNKPNYVGALDANKAYRFVAIKPHNRSDAKMIIRSVKLGIDRIGMVALHILKLKRGDVIPEIVKSTTKEFMPKTWEEVPMDYECLFVENGEVYDYFVCWMPYDEKVKPLDNSVDCGCGSITTWKEFVSFEGGEADRLDTIHSARTNKHAYGLVVNVSISCHLDNFICNEYNTNAAIKSVANYAILYLTAAHLLEFILNQSEISRYTTMNLEALYGKRNHFRKEFNDRIQYLTANLDTSNTDCFVCKQGPIVSRLLRA